MDFLDALWFAIKAILLLAAGVVIIALFALLAIITPFIILKVIIGIIGVVALFTFIAYTSEWL